MVTPGAAGPPDMGVHRPDSADVARDRRDAARSERVDVPDGELVVGVPYPLVIGPLASTGIRVNGMALVRLGDMIPSPPGILTVLGPPAAPFFIDSSPP